MATVTSYTAERMKEIEDNAIVSGVIDGDNLILVRYDGTTINAGNVRGAQGPQGVTGDTAIKIVTSTTRPANQPTGQFIYETDTHRLYSWNGTAWVYRGGVVLCTSTTRPANPFTGLSIYETDTKRSYTWNGTVWSSTTGEMRCKVRRTTSQSIPSGLVTTITWTEEVYDTDNVWAVGSPGLFVVPANGAGLWRFILNAQFAINGTGGRHLSLTRNISGGGAEALGTWNNPGSAAWYSGGTLVCEAVLGAGDTVHSSAYQSSGVALNLDIAYPIHFSAVRLAQ